MCLLQEQSKDHRRLGRHLHHDPRSRSYPVAELLSSKKPGIQTWFRRGVFDQGETSSCVGQAVAGLVMTSPHRRAVPKPALEALDPVRLYRLAQTLDPWPGAEPDYLGTSTLAGMKAAQKLGLISGYRWAFGLSDVLNTLTSLGPVVIGVQWYESFDDTGADGRLHIAGDARGGHAVQLLSINSEDKTVRGVNSWGLHWGDRGRFELSFDDLDRLLHEDGEAVFALPPG